jgi:predicted unusual protein kinase regulating ubiquinone biosynthesis (AarF/ABC1/UbiB family)
MPALGELARQVAILIDHGILHADFHPGNVLIDDRDRVYIIDLDKTGTYRGAKTALRSKYHRRWCRAVRKHGLPPVLCEFQAGIRGS